MPFKRLHQHPHVQLVHQDKHVTVPIAYSDEQHAFELLLTGDEDLNLPEDLPLLVTEDMAHQLVYQPDGTVQLRI